MPKGDDAFERLRAAIDQLAAEDARNLLSEARVEARARVRATLADALAHSMLERLHEQLPSSGADEGLRSAQRPSDVARPAQEARQGRRAGRGASQAGPSGRGTRSQGRRAERAQAWYVYGVVTSEAELSGPLQGVDPASEVTPLTEGPLAAVACQVPLEEFGEERLREHLGDMSWVEATARAHEQVLDRVREQTTVVPMRMCTVYRTEGGVREMLSREAAPLREALEHLDGKAEWGVKVFLDPAGGGPGDADAGPGESSGTAYMQRKQTERSERQRALELIEQTTSDIHERLSKVARDALVVPPQRPEVSGHGGDMILNGVYLVADDDRDSFDAEVRALQAEFGPQGIELVPTGPWPAYNFVPGTIGAAW